MSGYYMKDYQLAQNVAGMEVILSQLPLLSPLVFVDIGDYFFPGIDRILALCNEVLVVVEPHPITLMRAKPLLEDLKEQGFGKSRLMTLVQNNRVRSDVQLTWTQVQDALEAPVQQVISSAPELAYQGALRNLPMMVVPPEGLVSQQYVKLAEFYLQRTRK
jgi:Flp pilus assembly CpaE family ATPase